MNQKFLAMLSIQDGLNKKVHPYWKNAEYDWRDAIMIEAGELYDHLPWKWWKVTKGPVDWGQANLEAVDIWHFILSEILQEATESSMKEIVFCLTKDTIDPGVKDPNPIANIKHMVKDLLYVTLYPFSKGIPISKCAGIYGDSVSLVQSFKRLIDAMDLEFDTLYKLYVSKAKLNEFRWANGYGTRYVKDWFGQEDNQFLTQLLETLDINDPEFGEKISTGLAVRYAEVLEAQTKAKDAEIEAHKERVLEIL